MNNIEIIPAIMPKSFADLSAKVSIVAPFVSSVQLDIMDGIFVGEKTWPYVNSEGELEKIEKEEIGFPEWEKINYEIDLMVKDSEKEALRWIALGASRAIIHIEEAKNLKNTISEIREKYGDSKVVATAPEIGLAINVETPLEKLDEFIPLVDFVQHMGIAEIGFQGQPFDERTLERVLSLRKKYPELVISIDGAVNHETAGKLVEAGANRLVSGSYIFNAENIQEAIDILKR